MQSSPVSPADYTESVRSYLASALPDSQLSTENVLDRHQPLLLMKLTNLVVAFAFSDGNARGTYNTLYEGFKRYYTQQKHRLESVDLMFVYCVPKDLPSFGRICSEIETDVYFCRKFVVPLYLPMYRSLARLPFLPLLPDDRESFRPQSAQTFLQRSGVPGKLTQYLVIPHHRSPKRIVEDCTQGTFGNLSTLDAPDLPSQPTESSAQQIRLKSISIQGFRAYRKRHQFDLSGDVTVLYGPNGFGKTSFFDAVDFAATGEIGRLKARLPSTRFAKAATHLDGNPKDSVVSLSFTSNGSNHTVTRRVVDRMNAKLNGRTCDRKTILSALNGTASTDDRIEHLTSLFRATHLFSQEHQELTQRFEHDCQLSEEAVSRMLALEGYANASKKTTAILNIFRHDVKLAKAERQKLSLEVSDETKQLDELGQKTDKHIDPGVLGSALLSLKKRVLDSELHVSEDVSDLTYIRACRGAIEAKLSETEARIRRLSSLAIRVASLPHVTDDLKNSKRDCVQARA